MIVVICQIKQLERVLAEQLVEVLLQEYFPQPNILCDYEEAFSDCNSGRRDHFIIVIHFNEPLNILLQDQVDDLAAVGHYFQGQPGHMDVFVIEQLPMSEAHVYLLKH